MSTLFIGSKITIQKILSRRKYRILLYLCLLLSVFVSIFSAGGVRLNLFSESFAFSSGTYTSFAFLNSIAFPLISLMLGADFFAQEISSSTIKFELLRPISRTKLYFSKLLGMFFYCVIILFGCMLLSMIICLFNGSVTSIWRILLSGLMILLVCITFLSCSALLSVITASPVLTMFLGILIYLALSALSVVSHLFAAVSFTSHTEWYKMIISSQIAWQSVFQRATLFISYIGLSCGIGQLIFDRRNIH